MTKREAAIIAAYTGYLVGDFKEYHRYVETLVGKSLTVGEMGAKETLEKIHDLSKPDFIAIEIK